MKPSFWDDARIGAVCWPICCAHFIVKNSIDAAVFTAFLAGVSVWRAIVQHQQKSPDDAGLGDG